MIALVLVFAVVMLVGAGFALCRAAVKGLPPFEVRIEDDYIESPLWRIKR